MSKSKLPDIAESVYTWVDVPIKKLKEVKPKGKTRPQSMRDYAINRVVGNEIKRLRKLRGLTVIEMSSRLSITQAQLSYYENAQASISIALQYDLADVLEVDPSHFLKVASTSL